MKDIILSDISTNSTILYTNSKNTSFNLHFGVSCVNDSINELDPIYILFKQKFGKSFENILRKTSFLKKEISADGVVTYKKEKFITIDGYKFFNLPFEVNFDFFKYDVYINDQIILKNQSSKKLSLPNFIFTNSSIKELKIKLYFNELENLNLLTRQYFQEKILILNIIDNLYNLETLNASNTCAISANGYTITLSPGNEIGVMVVENITRDSDHVKISKIMLRKANKIDSYKTLVVGSEISFIEKDSNGDTILNSGIELSLFFHNFLDPNLDNPQKIGTISISPLKDMIKFLPYQYYGCSSDKTLSNSLLVDEKENMLFSPHYLEEPLFFYFVIKGKLNGEINLINEEKIDVPYKVLSYDEETHFIFFNALKDRTYHFFKDGHYFLKEYFEIPNSYIETFNCDKYLSFDSKYLDKLVIQHPYEKQINVLVHLESGSTVLKTNVSTTVVYEPDSESGGLLTFNDIKSITSIHIPISEKVKKIEFFDLLNNPLDNVTFYNVFTNYSKNNQKVLIYKKQDEQYYFAQKSVEYEFNEIDVQSLAIGERYILKNSKFFPCYDGYIEFSEIYHDSYFYYDYLGNLKEKTKNKVFSYIISKQHEKEVVDYFVSNFKTPNMHIELKKGVK